MAMPDFRYAEAAKGHESPTYDMLKPQWQQFVLAWLRTQDYAQSALDSGYAPKYAYQQGYRLSRQPDIVKATEEVANRRLRSAEQGRGQVVHRLLMESLVSKADLVEDVMIEGKLTQRIRKREEIDECYHSCLGFVEYSREGDVRFNTTAQSHSRKLLASYMKWDREAADTAPALTFSFGVLKPGVEAETPPKPQQ